MREFWKIIRFSFVIFITLLLIISSAIYGMSTYLFVWNIITILYNLISNLFSGLYWLGYKIFIVHPHLIALVLPILIIIAFIIIFWKDINTKTIIIEPFDVPDELHKSGYTGKVIANKLIDQINIISNKAKNPNLPTNINNTTTLTPSAILSTSTSENDKIVIPQTGISVGSLIGFIRKILHKDGIHISGEITIAGKSSQQIIITTHCKNENPTTLSGKLYCLDDNLQTIALKILEKKEPYKVASFYFAQNNMDKAFEYFQEILRKKPKNAAIHTNLGVIYFRQGKLNDAENFFLKAIELNPTLEEAYVNLGGLYGKQGKFHDAEKFLFHAIELNPQLTEAYHNLGIASIHQGQHKLNDAAKYLLKVIELNSSNAEAYSNLGSVYQNMGKLDKAFFYNTKAIELNPNLSQAHNNLGSLHYLLAMEVSTKLGSTFIKSTNIKYENHLKNAEQFLLQAIKLNPNLTEAYINLGALYCELEQYDKSIEYSQRVLMLNSKEAKAYNHLGAAYLKLGKTNKAIQNFKKANKLDPKNLNIIKNLQNVLTTILQNDANLSLAHYDLGCLLYRTGDITGAINEFQAVIELNNRPRLVKLARKILKRISNQG